VKYVEENAEAAEISLTSDHLAALDEAMPVGVAAGERYAEEAMGTLEL
jgi:aryl-alcohol dehydrogenase-like predicted oxidoreductase